MPTLIFESPYLDTTECIPITNKNKTYTDCMEFSLLRFLHFIFSDPEEINKNNKTKWNIGEMKISDDFVNYINNHQYIYPRGSYYTKDTEGQLEREKWTKFTSERKNIEYYRDDNAELFTCLKNIFSFMENIFNIKLNKNDSENINTLNNFFQKNMKKIEISLWDDSEKKELLGKNEILMMLSKEKTEYENKLDQKEKYEVIFKKTMIDIKVNEFYYEWHLDEVFLSSKYSEITNKYVSGHSVIYPTNNTL
jgi:hypothetical protein